MTHFPETLLSIPQAEEAFGDSWLQETGGGGGGAPLSSYRGCLRKTVRAVPALGSDSLSSRFAQALPVERPTRTPPHGGGALASTE